MNANTQQDVPESGPRKFSVAVGNGRLGHFRQYRETWPELIERLRAQCTKLPVTKKRYAELSRAEKGDLKKRLPWFFGGQYGPSGERKRENILLRSLVNPDLDKLAPEVYEAVLAKMRALGIAFLHVSSASDGVNGLRSGRLIVPLSRDGTQKESVAVSRLLSAKLSIENVDPAGHRPNQLCFAPSCCSDSEVVFEEHRGPLLDVEALLAELSDWEDVAQWPHGEQETSSAYTEGSRRGDPRERSDLGREFNRRFSVEEAILEFDLPFTEVEEWLYLPHEATGAPGAKIFGLPNDPDYAAYLYSFHQHGPRSGRSSDAYELVAACKFGDLDKNAISDTPFHKLPSTRAMNVWIHATYPEMAAAFDTWAIADLGFVDLDAKEGALPAVAPEVAPAIPAPRPVLNLRVTRNGVIPDEENVRRILVGDPSLQGIVRYDEFSGEMILRRPIAADRSIVAERGIPRPWTDADTVTLQPYIQRHIVPRMGREKIEAVLGMHARHNCAFHPVRDYLQSCSWDGVPRLNTWLRGYLGANKQPEKYLAAVGAAWLIAAVARIFEPGCQADNALVFEGAQGIYKSTALRVLAGDAYFSDSLSADLSHKDARDHLRGKWILELAELAQFKRAEIETVKQFISRRFEQHRPSYGRHEIKFPRQCVFAGSTNDESYLSDPTGNRRFWVVACSRVEIAAIKRDRDQLWGEAVVRYRAGEQWHLTPELDALAAAEAQLRVAHDPWTAKVAEIIARHLSTPDVAPGEIMRLMNLNEGERSPRNAGRVGQILKELSWQKGCRDRTRGQIYTPPPGWSREDAATEGQVFAAPEDLPSTLSPASAPEPEKPTDVPSPSVARPAPGSAKPDAEILPPPVAESAEVILARQNANGAHVGWKKLPSQRHEFRCLHEKKATLRAALDHCGVGISSVATGKNGSVVFAASVPVDAKVRSELLAAVATRFNQLQKGHVHGHS